MLAKTHINLINHLGTLSEGHILYIFNNVEEYIKNIEDFVISGLEQNQYCIIIENDRISHILKNMLTSTLAQSELDKVFIINNYDFYYAKGDFRCSSIFDYLPKLIEGYEAEKEFPLRSWAHVEWGDEREVHKKLATAETEADVIVSEKRLLSVCAYDFERVSEELKRSLINQHNFLFDDQKN
jgi:hypothetical protein